MSNDHPDPVPAAASLLLLRDGAMAAGYLDGGEARDLMLGTAGPVLNDDGS